MPENLIIDHDGAVDDLIALGIILASDQSQYCLKAVTICPADSYRDGATESTLKFLAYFGHPDVPVASCDEAGINPFPSEWRQKSRLLAKIPALDQIDITSNQELKMDACDLICELLGQAEDNEYVMLMTGPMTNLYLALHKQPALKTKIKRIYFMGGAVTVVGNVEAEKHDGSAEWNLYNHATSAQYIFASGIPITVVPLDACNSVPVTTEFLDQIKDSYPLLSQSWELSRRQVEAGIYYFWDPLTAAVLIDSRVIQTQKMKISISTSAPNEGQTYVSDDGNEVDVAINADEPLFKSILLKAYEHKLQ
jgi:purine nucleosidase